MARCGGQVDRVVGGLGTTKDGDPVDVGVLEDGLILRAEGGRVKKGGIEGRASVEGGHVGHPKDAGCHDKFLGF